MYVFYFKASILISALFVRDSRGQLWACKYEAVCRKPLVRQMDGVRGMLESHMQMAFSHCGRTRKTKKKWMIQ